jgi:hypothetical protein
MIGGDGGALARSQVVDFALVAGAADLMIAREMQVTLYHILWELVEFAMCQECSREYHDPAIDAFTPSPFHVRNAVPNSCC